MEDSMKRDIEDFEADVKVIRKLIEEAKSKLNSIEWTDVSLRNAYERTIIFQERQLELSIQNHKMLLGLHREG